MAKEVQYDSYLRTLSSSSWPVPWSLAVLMTLIPVANDPCRATRTSTGDRTVWSTIPFRRVRQRQIHTVILIGILGDTRDDVGGELGGS